MPGIASHRSYYLRPGSILFTLFLASGLGAVTINELHYNPPGSASGLEFIELHNDAPTTVDLSLWSFTEGIDLTFPRGTWIRGKGYVVICANEAIFKAAYPNVIVAGSFVGRLDSDGETLVLSNQSGGEVVRLRYSDRGKWPAAASGTGHTLSLRRPHLDPSEPESWAASTFPGGTPGAINFSGGAGADTDLIALGSPWFYKKGTAEFSDPVDAWRQISFATGTWLTGNTGIGYGDNDDATDLAADMPNGYLSIALRKSFPVSVATMNNIDQLFLAVNYDDGFVAYLNGAEVLRVGLPGVPGTHVPFNAPAINHEAGAEELFELPKSALIVGTNLLAIQGHNAALDSSDFSLAPRLIRRRLVGASKAPAGLAFNEFFGRTLGPRWVEFHNASTLSIDLRGFFLSDDANQLTRYALPASAVIAPGGFLVVTELASGLDFSPAVVRLFLTMPDQSATVLAQVFANIPNDGLASDRAGTSDARLPDGVGEFAFATSPTPGAANTVNVSQDIVINEVFYNPPLGNLQGEFLELHNRGVAPVNIGGWSFTRGVSFAFPVGTTLAAGDYLVVAQDPAALSAAHGLAAVLGPWEGNLANSGEAIRLVDALGNTVDEVRYFDGGRWSEWADGGGSSLELLDPRQDNSFASAWAGSDESSKAEWKRFTYTAAYTPEAESELHLLLMARGVVHVDEVSLKRIGSLEEYIPNGNFETDTSPWLIQGTHIDSRRITTDAHAGSACLALSASGAGDHAVNKIDTDTLLAMTASTYTVSFWARWIRGCHKLITRADARSRANLQRVNTLSVPKNLGTPGALNSVRAQLLAQVATGNLGPVIDAVSQDPVVPSMVRPVRITARVYDADGVQAVTVNYRTGGLGDGVFAAAPLFDDGLHGDGRALDGIFAGTIPPQAVVNTRVLFYLEAFDALGAVGRYPAEAPARTLLYTVESTLATALVNVRINLDEENIAELNSRLLHSDDLVDASFVYNDEEIYYNVGVRYRGSPWGRPGEPKNFRVRFNEDRPFIRGLHAVNLSRSAWALNEGTAYYAVQSTGRVGSPSPSSDYIYTRTFRNGTFHAQMALIETINAGYATRWFPRDPDGYVFKAAAWPYMNDAGTMDGVVGSAFVSYGTMNNFEYENYRWYYPQGTRQLEDRWDDIVQFCTIMDPGRTATNVFDASIENILDVEQFMRVLVPRVLQDDWDTVGVGGGHNAYLYFAPQEGRMKLLPWDMDNTYVNPEAKLYPENADPGVTRLIQRPKYRRLYLRVVEEMLATTWNASYFNPYLQQVGATAGLDANGIINFMNVRRPAIAALIPATSFKVTNLGTLTIPEGWNREYYTKRTRERLRGNAPVSLDTVAVSRDGVQIALNILWGVSTWSFDLPIDGLEHDFDVFGFSTDGQLLGSESFRVVSTAGWSAPAIQTITPGAGPLTGGTPVRIVGEGFRAQARVLFAGLAGSAVNVLSPNELEVVTPAAVTAGKVAVRVVNIDNQLSELANAFEYTTAGVFVRGDATGDFRVDLADAIRTLFFLFAGGPLDCLDAADVQNDGSVNLTDVLATLNYLFRAGVLPVAPFPDPGVDPVAPMDSLGCQ